MLESFTITEGARATGQDVVGVFPFAAGEIVLLADGAGGTSGGREAAELVVRILSERALQSEAVTETFWRQAILELAIELESLGAGQSTAVAIAHRGRSLCGGSIGDCEAWLIGRDGLIDLTQGQARKPLLGGGLAEPRTFSAQIRPGELLLVASDGLFKYATRERIVDCLRARGASLESIGHALIALARMPNGGLQDDIGIALVRRRGNPDERLIEQLKALGQGDDSVVSKLGNFEQWLQEALPHWCDTHVTDGLFLSHQAVIAGTLYVTGYLIDVTDQRWRPFELALELEALTWRLFYGLPGDAGLREPEYFEAGVPREWAFTAESQ